MATGTAGVKGPVTVVMWQGPLYLCTLFTFFAPGPVIASPFVFLALPRLFPSADLIIKVFFFFSFISLTVPSQMSHSFLSALANTPALAPALVSRCFSALNLFGERRSQRCTGLVLVANCCQQSVALSLGPLDPKCFHQTKAMLVLVQNQLYASAFGETAHIFFMFQNQLLHNAVMRS